MDLVNLVYMYLQIGIMFVQMMVKVDCVCDFGGLLVFIMYLIVDVKFVFEDVFIVDFSVFVVYVKVLGCMVKLFNEVWQFNFVGIVNLELQRD